MTTSFHKPRSSDLPIKVSGPWSDISYKPDLEGMLKDQVKDPAAVLEKLEEGGGAKELLEGLKPGGSGTDEGAGSDDGSGRSEEQTSELQSLMRNSYAAFCLNNKKNNKQECG